MEQLLTGAANYGFPMVVTAFLLVRIEGKLERLGESINQLARAIDGKSPGR